MTTGPNSSIPALAVAVSDATNIEVDDVTVVIESLLEAITQMLTAGERVVLTGFGALSPAKPRGRKALADSAAPANPRPSVSFKPAETLRRRLAGGT